MRSSLNTTSFARCLSTLNYTRAMFFRHFSDTGRGSNTLPSITKSVQFHYRSWAIRNAQEALTDYLHNTRALPFTYAELISKNATYCLYETICMVPFSSTSFRNKFSKFLTYNPINEYVFFFESIGIDYGNVNGVLKPNVHFFSDDRVVLDAACCLAENGFPWGKLGRMYLEEASIFKEESEFLKGRIDGLVSLGFSNQQIVSICLTFPCVLKGEGRRLSGENGPLLDELKRVFVDFDFGSSLERNDDVWSEVCRKVKVFYDLGVAKGEVGMLLVKCRSILTDSAEVLAKKAEFFSKLGFEKAEVVLLFVSNPETLSIQIHDREISVSSLLEHFGFCKEKLKVVEQKYKYAFGRNSMVNLPNILKAIDLHEWFLDRMKCGYHHLFANYDLTSPDDGVDEKYVQNMECIKRRSKTCIYWFSKLDFFHGIGFGRNGFAMKLLVDVHVSPSELQVRFDFLLNKGIEFPKLCKMIIREPKILNQDIDSLAKKINFLEEIGFFLDYLEVFPAYLVYNLEKRIKPRYKFHMWLIEQGLSTQKYKFSSILAVSHKKFLSQLSRIHPTAPQLWLERHGTKNAD